MATTTTQFAGGGLLIPVVPPPGTFAARLRHALQQFVAQLKDTENFRIIAVLGSRTYAVEHITVRGSELVVIDGPAEDVNRYRIMCHVKALQLMLMVEPKQPHEKRRRIGFLWEEAGAEQAGAAAPAAPGAAQEVEVGAGG